MMDKFSDMQENDDLTQLIITGTPPEEALQQARLEIISQFQAAIANAGAQKHKRLVGDTECLKVRINRVTVLIAALRAAYDPEIAEELRIDGFDYDFTPESLETDLSFVEIELKNDEVDLELRQQQLDDMNKEAHGPKSSARRIYMDNLLAAGSLMSTRYRMSDTTVEEYTILYNKLEQQAKNNK